MPPDPTTAWLEQPPPRSLDGLPAAFAAQRRRLRGEVFFAMFLLLVFVPVASVLGGPVGAGLALGFVLVATAALWRRMVGGFERALRTAVVQPCVVHAARRVKLSLGGRTGPVAGLELELRTEGAPPAWAYVLDNPPPTAETIGASVGLLRLGRYGALVVGLASGVHQGSVSDKQNTQLQTVPG